MTSKTLAIQNSHQNYTVKQLRQCLNVAHCLSQFQLPGKQLSKSVHQLCHLRGLCETDKNIDLVLWHPLIGMALPVVLNKSE